MKLEEHPFNNKFGLPSITADTTKLILGTFPAYQVTSKDKPRLDFYYGSTDNKFWDLFREALNPKLEINADNVREFLRNNQTGIIDIIRKCYRKDNKSSADEHLSVIEMEDMVKILLNSKIETIFSTSEFVTKLLKQQIEPLLDRRHPTKKGSKLKKAEIFVPEKIGEFEFIKVKLPREVFNIERHLSIKTLYSPSDQGIRGLTKGINSKKLDVDALNFRLEQYKQLLN